jgi:Asp-tRNA(Asn)/Glu-tRNA(Gln) amidotransferase A subunit family amidase
MSKTTSKYKLRNYVALADGMRAGTITPRTYLDDTLKLIAERDAGIGAFVVVNKDAAIKAADAATARWRAGKPLSPIDGMPVAIKDIIETADMPTGEGSPLFEGRQSHRDSASVHALREAGAIIIGKTTTTEFAASFPFHTTKNPHDPKRTPGGSSSGSAAAVGAGMVPAGLGTQVVGSILRPSSFCGAVGCKPSVGAINRSGSHDHFSQSCQGAIGATLGDVWAVLRAIADRAGGDPGFAGLAGDANLSRRRKPARLAILQTGGWGAISNDAREAFAATRERLAKTGIELCSRTDDPGIEATEQAMVDALPLTQAINAWEGRWPLNTYADLDASKLSDSARERLRTAEKMTQRDYQELIVRRAVVRATYEKAASRYDAFVTLGACGAAPVGLGSTGNTVMNVGASLLGCPALTLPLLSDEGLPLGLQLLGAMNKDAALFEVAAWVASDAFGRTDLVGGAD